MHARDLESDLVPIHPIRRDPEVTLQHIQHRIKVSLLLGHLPLQLRLGELLNLDLIAASLDTGHFTRL